MDTRTPTADMDLASRPRAEKPKAKPPARALLATGAAVIVAGAGALWLTAQPAVETTDDAYTASDATTIAPKIRGLVAQVLVHDNQVVKTGQPLIVIDPEEYDARVAAAEADLARAQAGLDSADAAVQSLAAEKAEAADNAAAAETQLPASAAQFTRSDADRKRYQALVDAGAVAQSEADRLAAEAVSAKQAVAHAQAAADAARENIGVVQAKAPVLAAAVETAKAQVAQAQAGLNLARQDRDHATIFASVDGVVGNRQVQVGDYVQPGTRLLTLVPAHGLYVTANFKETQTGRMVPGQPVTVRIDAFGGKALTGHVESLAPGSGSTFSLLPYEPGTGNFTKIVQRIPVRIRLDPGQPLIDRLRPGLSVTAKVRVAGAS